jgi:hypothetical protein
VRRSRGSQVKGMGTSTDSGTTRDRLLLRGGDRWIFGSWVHKRQENRLAGLRVGSRIRIRIGSGRGVVKVRFCDFFCDLGVDDN